MATTDIKYPTPIEKDIEKAIQDRLFNGFKNWNGGYDGWLKWCETLYEPDAYYNIPGPKGQIRLTLQANAFQALQKGQLASCPPFLRCRNHLLHSSRCRAVRGRS